VGLKLNGTHQLLIYADDLNLQRDNIDTRKKIKGTIIDASKELGLEVNAEKIKYMLLSPQQKAGKIHDITTVIRSFENVAQFVYLGTIVTDQNLI
jgi:hypothetical protein